MWTEAKGLRKSGRLGSGLMIAIGMLVLAMDARSVESKPGQAPPIPLVVVIDSGMASEHPVFQERLLDHDLVKSALPAQLGSGSGKFWVGWDFVENDAEPQDRTGHGTHVAGLVAEALGPPAGMPARLVMFRTGDRQHELAPVAAALEAVVAMLESGWNIPVVLCAFDYRRTPKDGADFERFAKAFRKLLDSNVLCVCAAGNAGQDLDSSEDGEAQYQVAFSHPSLIAVAACTDDGQLLAASNYGVKSVALATPGFAALSAAREGGQTAMSGSSQAAARVAGRLMHHAVTAKDSDPKKLRAWLLKEVRVAPSLVGRVASAGFLPLEKKAEE